MNLVTIIIVTRNRSSDLAECLNSLRQQMLPPYKILVVNNASTDQTTEVISHYTKNLPIQHVVEINIGHAYAYNRGILEAKTKWIAFIDDDCIADVTWYQEIVKTIVRLTKSHQKVGVILGKTQNYFCDNVFSTAFHIGTEYWRRENMQNNKIINYQVLDSRNIVYNRELLLKEKLLFNPDAEMSGAQDIELGIRIQTEGIGAVYNESLIVSHKNPTTFGAYFKKNADYDRTNSRVEHFLGSQMVKKNLSIGEKIEILVTETRRLHLVSRLLAIALFYLNKKRINSTFLFLTRSQK